MQEVFEGIMFLVVLVFFLGGFVGFLVTALEGTPEPIYLCMSLYVTMKVHEIRSN